MSITWPAIVQWEQPATARHDCTARRAAWQTGAFAANRHRHRPGPVQVTRSLALFKTDSTRSKLAQVATRLQQVSRGYSLPVLTKYCQLSLFTFQLAWLRSYRRQLRCAWRLNDRLRKTGSPRDHKICQRGRRQGKGAAGKGRADGGFAQKRNSGPSATSPPVISQQSRSPQLDWNDLLSGNRQRSNQDGPNFLLRPDHICGRGDLIGGETRDWIATCTIKRTDAIGLTDESEQSSGWKKDQADSKAS